MDRPDCELKRQAGACCRVQCAITGEENEGITECLLVIASVLFWVFVLPLAGFLAGGVAISNELRALSSHRGFASTTSSSI